MNLKSALLSAFILLACNNAGKKTYGSAGDSGAASVQKPRTVSEIEPALFKADSMQAVFYDNPDGDSLRYTRFFSHVETNDTVAIQTLTKEMDQVFVQQNATRQCRSEGKLFLMNGENVLKTIYFSTRKDSCSYFYFIKDGSFIYLPLSSEASGLLKTYKVMARKPK